MEKQSNTTKSRSGDTFIPMANADVGAKVDLQTQRANTQFKR